MNKKNIAFVISHTTHSPQWEWFIEELSQYCNIIFIIIGDSCYLSDALLKKNIITYTLHHSSIFSYFKNILSLIRIFKKHQINIVQTEMPIGNLTGLIAAYLCGIQKRIATASNVTWFIDYQSTKQKWIDKITYYLSTHIITQTDLSKQFIVQYFKIPESKITTIHHAYKASNYEDITPERIKKIIDKLPLKITDDTFIIGMIARFEEWKGHEYAIRAMEKVKKVLPTAKLLIFGGGDDSKLRTLIHELQLNDTVYLCGFEKDIFALYKIFHLQVHVPIDAMCETFGITILDGMMSKLPQILTQSGIAYFTAKHLENCWIVPYKNSESIADAIIHLYQNPSLREKLSKNAYQIAKSMFSLEQKVQKHIEIYSL